MSSQNRIIEAYLGFVPQASIMLEHNLKADELFSFVVNLGLRDKRAKLLIEKLEDLDETFPTLIKEAIWKLQVIRFLAGKYSSGSIQDLNSVEKISNYAIKAKLEDYTTWGAADYTGGLEVIVISNEQKLDVGWVAAVADSDLKGLEQYAKTLRDKVTLQDSIKEVLVVTPEHAAACKEEGLDPREYTPKELAEYQRVLREWRKDMDGLNRGCSTAHKGNENGEV